MNRLRILIGLGLSATLLGCGDQRVAGGNSSETPNTLTGILYDTLGKPRAGDTVTLRPARWTAEDRPPAGARATNVWTTVTDSSGRWNVAGMESGAWVVESRKGDDGRLCATVTVGRSGRSWLSRRTLSTGCARSKADSVPECFPRERGGVFPSMEPTFKRESTALENSSSRVFRSAISAWSPRSNPIPSASPAPKTPSRSRLATASRRASFWRRASKGRTTTSGRTVVPPPCASRVWADSLWSR